MSVEGNKALSPEILSAEHELLVVGHTYQPHREIFLPSSGQRLDVVSFVNDRIYDECYSPLFVEGDIPKGFVFSFYPGLRDWLRKDKPEVLQKVVEKVANIPDREYQVLGDPYVHLIMPLQSRADQDMLLKIGRKAFKDDFGFEPKGLWLPETAVTQETLDVASENGYEFVVLRDSQLKRPDGNPVKIPTRNGRGIAAIHFNSSLSGSLSFDDGVSLNADNYLDALSRMGKGMVGVGSDTELYGHHKKERYSFLKYLEKPDTLKRHGFASFDVRRALERGRMDFVQSEVWDRSSWSCDHGLGRWTGQCDDDGANDSARADKNYLYRTLSRYGDEINSRLDALDPNWRDKYIDFFLATREIMFSGQDGSNLPRINPLAWAKTCELVGKTSCGWFFGKDRGPEREIPRTMIGEIEMLLPDIQERTVFQAA